MYIIKNAFRNITRSKGRSILIGIIITIIAFSVCVGLCIRQSASDAKESALSQLTVTAQISPDREAAMEEAKGQMGSFGDSNNSGGFDKSQLMEAMNESLSLAQLQKYAEADSVQSFYYTTSASFNAAGTLEAYSTDASSSSSSTESESEEVPGMQGQAMGGGFSSGDFQITGYSSDEAMTEFVDGTYTITDGSVFEAGSSNMTCIISDELATYNDLEVGDTIKLANTDNDSEVYKLEIAGIYNNSQASADAAGGDMRGGFVDPANNIYMSYQTLNKIVSESETSNEGEDTSAITARLNGTFVVGDVDAYEQFQDDVEEIGLEDGYIVSSSDLSAYEQSAQPLENLSKFAGYFLIVILVIGAIILVVLNIFATRERKYEIGVLTAIGMKKSKVARLFVSEILIIALAGVIVGGAIGSAVSVPVTNSLLASQIESVQSSQNDRNGNFGRDFGGGASGSSQSDETNQQPLKQDGSQLGGASYINSVTSSVNIVVLGELLICCIVLAGIAGAVSVVSIMRYEPLKILANRD